MAALKKVMLAEDDADIQTVVRLSLKMRGVTDVLVVENGEECLAGLRDFRPDVILLDVMMPKLDGYETCRRLKENPATRTIPVVFLTAKTQHYEIERGLGLGAAGYLTKPFDPMKLYEQLVALLEEKKGK
jgi:two-component system, OmpR family, response regulator